MNSKTLTETDALQLTIRNEDHFFDRKALAASGKSAQKIGVAFANSDGGEFAVGVADVDEEPDPENRWNGVTKVEDFNGHIQALTEVKPPLPMELSILDAPGRRGLVLLARIESPEVHQTSDGTVYVRKELNHFRSKTNSR